MKKLFILLTIVIFCSDLFGQGKTTYKVAAAEKYVYINDQYILSSSKKRKKISISIMWRLIHIKAKTDGYFHYHFKNKKVINEPDFSGYSFTAIDYLTGEDCIIDIVRFNSGVSMIAISYKDPKLKLQYYIKEKINFDMF